MSSSRFAQWLLAGICALLAGGTFAGEQRYEPLSASVRAALHRSVADQASPRHAFFSREEGAAWLQEMSKRVERQIPDTEERENFLTTVHYEATRAGLDPQMVLGVIYVESRFRKYAVSRAGARGYMQVMPFWVDLIGEETQNLFSLRTNLRYGCTILRHYLDIERGDLYRALGRYNGSLGKSRYPNAVLRAWHDGWEYSPKAAVQKANAEAPARKKTTRRETATTYLGDG
ncbi:MAG TPA: lytic transglycosylase domain-containing protein [Burkholderiales bacterium]